MERYIWPLKIAAKIVLSRAPVSYDFWREMGIFRLGKMDTVAHALKIFRIHAKEAFGEGNFKPGMSVLELGPGDSIATALVAASYGAGEIWLADVGAYANRDITLYKNMAQDLRAEGLNPPDLNNAQSFEDVLQACNARYVTEGLKSLKQIPSENIDLVFSHSVFEHIRKCDFQNTMHELHRILKQNGRMSCSIDLKDHLAQSLNNLRFSDSIWENNFFANSGFYTNRLRASEILQMLENAEFAQIFYVSGRWPELPLPRAKMAAHFRNMSEDDLYIRTMHLVSKPTKAIEKVA